MKLLTPHRSASTADGRHARGDATRARVLQAALGTASVQGLNGVTIGPLADAAGVSKGHLALLFGNREQLQLATLDAAAAVFREHVLAPAERASSAAEKLRRVCLGWFDYVQQRVLPGGCLFTAAASEFRTIDGAVRDRLIEHREGWKQRLRLLIRSALDANRTLPDVTIEDCVYQILAYQAAANVALLLGDTKAFHFARRSTVTLIASITDDGSGEKSTRR